MIGVLVSGEGTNLQALIEAGLPIAAVASNRVGAGALASACSVGEDGVDGPPAGAGPPQAARPAAETRSEAIARTEERRVMIPF